jgi:hypothetical protein
MMRDAITDPDGIELFRLQAVKRVIGLEAKGMRHSSGRSVKAMWARHFGLSPRAKADVVLQAIDDRIAELEKRRAATLGRKG